ncbi:MAG: glycosyltransferase family 4 protein [Acidobacteria bacterium]|nr:glycosyltransferase family 4 protein [Acidobacteriota bacterium]
MAAPDLGHPGRPRLVANYGFVLGGGEVGLRMLLAGLAARGQRALVAVPGKGRLFPEFDQTSMPAGSPATIRALADECDVIHTFSVRSARRALLASTGKPVLLHALTAAPEPGDAVVSRSVAGVICNSRATARRFEAVVQPRVVYNGVAAPVPPVTPPPARAGRRTIGVVGNVCPRKGQLDVLPSLARVLELRHDVDVVFAGSLGGAVGVALRDHARASGGRIRVLGFVPDIADHLASYALVVVPSRSEGFGRVAVEAPRAGTSVLATQVDGLVEALSALRDPWLPADRTSWAARIVRELDAPIHSRHELVAADAAFDPAGYVDAIVECYEDARNGTWPTPPPVPRRARGLPERVDVSSVLDPGIAPGASAYPVHGATTVGGVQLIEARKRSPSGGDPYTRRRSSANAASVPVWRSNPSNVSVCDHARIVERYLRSDVRSIDRPSAGIPDARARSAEGGSAIRHSHDGPPVVSQACGQLRRKGERRDRGQREARRFEPRVLQELIEPDDDVVVEPVHHEPEHVLVTPSRFPVSRPIGQHIAVPHDRQAGPAMPQVPCAGEMPPRSGRRSVPPDVRGDEAPQAALAPVGLGPGRDTVARAMPDEAHMGANGHCIGVVNECGSSRRHRSNRPPAHRAHRSAPPSGPAGRHRPRPAPRETRTRCRRPYRAASSALSAHS